MSPDQELDMRLAEPGPGEVVRMTVVYPASPTTYTYAAVEAGGLWYLTGVDGGTGRNWGTLVDWLKNKNADIVSLRRTTSWEDIL